MAYVREIQVALVDALQAGDLLGGSGVLAHRCRANSHEVEGTCDHDQNEVAEASHGRAWAALALPM